MWHVRTLSPISMRDVSWMLRPPSHLVLLPACLLSPGYCCLVPGAWCLVLSGPRLPLLPATSLRCAYYRPGWPNDAASQPPSYRTSMDVKPTRQGMHHASHRQGDASRAHAVSLHDIISPSSEAEKPNALRQMPPHDARTLPESLAGGPSRSPVAPLSYGRHLAPWRPKECRQTADRHSVHKYRHPPCSCSTQSCRHGRGQSARVAMRGGSYLGAKLW